MAKDKNELAEKERTIDDVLAITPEVLQEDYVRVPSDMAYYGRRYAEALKRYLRADFASDKVEAELSIEWRETLEAEGKKVTENAITAKVHTDPRMEAAKYAEIEAEAEMQQLKVELRAIEAKRDMLIQLGAHARKEMEFDPSMREESRGRKAIESTKSR